MDDIGKYLVVRCTTLVFQCNESYDCEAITPKCSGKHCEIIDPKYRACLKASLRCPLMHPSNNVCEEKKKNIVQKYKF